MSLMQTGLFGITTETTIMSLLLMLCVFFVLIFISKTNPSMSYLFNIANLGVIITGFVLMFNNFQFLISLFIILIGIIGLFD